MQVKYHLPEPRRLVQECFKTLEGHSEEVVAVAVSPDGSYLASASLDKTIRTYRIISV